MKFVFALLLAMSLSFSAFASPGGKHDCCPEMDCGMVQCVDLGCAPSANPLAHPVAQALPQWEMVRDKPVEQKFELPTRHEEIWTPPD